MGFARIFQEIAALDAIMAQSKLSAILLRKVEYGDFDLILTFFSREEGKIALMAKSAKKSTKRFGGILELFSILQVVINRGGGKKLPILQEAALLKPFYNIRTDMRKTAYASYWSELILAMLEDGAPQPELYALLNGLLSRLDSADGREEALSILFQMRFLLFSGYRPVLDQCSACRTPIEQIENNPVHFDMQRGGLLCGKCGGAVTGGLQLSRGTVKQLLWLEKSSLATAARIRFSPQAIEEGLSFLEAFIPYHLGKQPRSLKFLRQMR
jgi:DNA repair protein RecO (recombination protein O)